MEELSREIHHLISQKNYPCVAAIKALHQNDFVIKVYDDFGSGKSWRALRGDLQDFLQRQQQSKSIYLTFWAVFEGHSKFSEDEFEVALWNELSHLSSAEKKQTDWPKDQSSDPENPAFCLSIDGKPFFVVGLHQNSSRHSRRFSKPTLVFNVFDQFKALADKGEYEPMKETIRKRDTKFQGEPNPMVVEHGDNWESIQFSGKNNPKKWKCPFHFMHDKDKSL